LHCVPDLTSKKPIPCLCFAVFGLVSISQLGCAAPSTSDSGVAHASTGYTLYTPIEVIAAEPGGAAVLDKNLPGLLEDPNYSAFKRMNLKTLASLSRGQIDQQSLAQTEADLEALRTQAAGIK
jgi:hypothetical protein